MFERDSEDLLALEASMASALSQLGKDEEAAGVYERVLEAEERSPRFGPSHQSTWCTRANLGISYTDLGRFSEAIPLLHDSLAAYDGMGLGPEHPQLGSLPHHYGSALLGAGRAAEAVPLFQRAIDFRERKFGLHHEFITHSLLSMAEALCRMGRGWDERLPLLDRAAAIHDLSIGRENNRNEAGLARALRAAAECCEEAGHLAGAESRWAKCVSTATKVSGYCSCTGCVSLCSVSLYNLNMSGSIYSHPPLNSF